MEEVYDGKTTVKPITIEQKGQLHQSNFQLRYPVSIAGFRDAGLVRSISASYIIEKLNRHQMAYVDFEYIMPPVIYIGGKLRHHLGYMQMIKGMCVF